MLLRSGLPNIKYGLGILFVASIALVTPESSSLAEAQSPVRSRQTLKQRLMENRQALSDIRNEIMQAKLRLGAVGTPSPKWALPLTIMGGIFAGGPLLFGGGYMIYALVYAFSFGTIGSFFFSLPLAIAMPTVAALGLVVFLVGVLALTKKKSDPRSRQMRRNLLKLRKRYRWLKYERRRLLRESYGMSSLQRAFTNGEIILARLCF